MPINANTLDTEYYRKMRLINTIIHHLQKYFQMGIQNMVVEVHVANMEFRTIKVDTNPLKLGTVTDEQIRTTVEYTEYILWRTLNLNKEWFTLTLIIRNGCLLEKCTKVRFTESHS